MILRIGRGHIKPGTWDAYEEAYNRLLVDGERPRGLRARWLARDVDDEHGGYSISLWDDADDVSEWVTSDESSRVREEMRAFFVGDYRSHNLEVRAHEEFGED